MKTALPQHYWLLTVLMLANIVAVSPRAKAQNAGANNPGWSGPVAVAPSLDAKRLFVALADTRQIAVLDREKGTVSAKIDLPGEPTSLVVDPKTSRIYASCAGPASVVVAIDPGTLQIVQSLPAGHTATGMAILPDGSRLFVCNRFDANVSVFLLPDGKEVARTPTLREPVGAAATPDGKTVFVIHHLPAAFVESKRPAAAVTAMDAQSFAAVDIELPGGSSGVRGICASPDGKHVFVTHLLSRNTLPATQLERGWMNTNAVSILDAKDKKYLGSILLDSVDLGAANPWGVSSTPDGSMLCIAHAGTHELSVIDTGKMFQKFAARAESRRSATKIQTPAPPQNTGGVAHQWNVSVLSLPLDSSNDLGFLDDLRRRVPLPGNGPRGLAVADGKVYAAMYYSDALAVVDLRNPSLPSSSIPLGPPPRPTEQRRGEMLFHDATLCFQHWQSCESCHPDARTDTLNWDLMNDGFGNPKNSKSMLLSHRTPPAMSESVRESAEAAVRAGFRNILFRECDEKDAQAVDVYLKSLAPMPSPRLVKGALSPAAQRGKELFFSKQTGCAECHPAPFYTDLKMHNVGTRRPFDHVSDFDTPTLIETWRTAPYLHDGSCATLEDLIGKGNHGKPVGETNKLSPQEIADLVEFVLSL